MSLQDLAIYRKRDPFRFQKFNTAQKRLLRSLKDPKPESLTIVLFLKPNRVGGSRVIMAALSAIMFGTDHPMAQCAPFGSKWPFPVKSARLLSTSETLGDTGPIQKAMKEVFPEGRYTQSRGVGKSYNSALKTDGPWDMDTMSYGQDALSAAGSTKGLIVGSEPMPHDLFVECLTRLGGNGMLILECTQLDLAAYLEEMAEDAGGRTVDGIQYGTLKLDGKPVGEIRVVRGDIEESCSEHHNGHQSHSAIEATIAGWPPEEREARRTGKPLRLSGKIYPNWSDLNELAEMPAWHQKKWDAREVRISSVIDPHDRKPWACAWFATFPNDDVICIAEWPATDFHAAKSSTINDIEDYRAMIVETEAVIGMPIWRRWMDPNFGAAPKAGSGECVMDMLRRPCKPCLARYAREEAMQACKHRLAYNGAPNDIPEGHMLVRAAIGNPSRPKFYTLRDACPNMNYGMRRYAYREEKNPLKALSETPQYVLKDFPDLPRYGYNARFDKYPVVSAGLDVQAPTFLGPRARARRSGA